MSVRLSKEAKAVLQREGVLAEHIRAKRGDFNPETLSRSYGLPVDRVRQIITRNGGSYAK